MHLDFSRHIFEKQPNMKLPDNPSRVIQAVPCGRTETRDES